MVHFVVYVEPISVVGCRLGDFLWWWWVWQRRRVACGPTTLLRKGSITYTAARLGCAVLEDRSF